MALIQKWKLNDLIFLFLMQAQQVPPQQYPGAAPVGQYPLQQPYPVGQYPGQAVPPNMVHGSFDPGARFNNGASVNVPVSLGCDWKM